MPISVWPAKLMRQGSFTGCAGLSSRRKDVADGLSKVQRAASVPGWTSSVCLNDSIKH
jgi:hypothetical protein